MKDQSSYTNSALMIRKSEYHKAKKQKSECEEIAEARTEKTQKDKGLGIW